MESKLILVTGGTSGIGMALCEKLLINGNRVVAIGRNEDAVLHLKNQYSESFMFKNFDLNDVNLIDQLISELVDQNGKFDGFVNCAGLEETIPLTLYTPAKIQSIFNLNVFAGIEILRNVSKKKHSNDFASIVFLSSIMGQLGQPGKVGYSATKAAVTGIVKSAALELSKRKIRVNAILPGIVLTPMTEKLFLKLEQENINQIIDMHPLGVGKVDDVIPLILFLLSNGSKWITGQNIIIDGGYSIQ